MRTENLMRNSALATIHVAMAFCVAAGAVAQDRNQREELEQARGSLAETIANGVTNAERYDTNGFRVESSRIAQLGADLEPDGNRFELLNLSASGVFRVAVEKGRPMSTGGGLAIFHRDSGSPILSVGDADGDGALDGLTYSKVDKDGKALLDVTDYEADGQPDIRTNFADRYVELWHVDRWYRVENRDGRRGIVRNGVFVELRMENNRLIVP